MQRAAGVQTPLSAAQGACWTTDTIPAQVEMVLDSLEVTPGQYAFRERAEEIAPAEERLFSVPCPEVLDSTFIASLQRALAVRGLHDGAINGQMDGATQAAVRRFQAPQGLDSAVLSLAAAQQLGLVAVPRDAF